jgi:hypothetical protein
VGRTDTVLTTKLPDPKVVLRGWKTDDHRWAVSAVIDLLLVCLQQAGNHVYCKYL